MLTIAVLSIIGYVVYQVWNDNATDRLNRIMSGGKPKARKPIPPPDNRLPPLVGSWLGRKFARKL